MSLLFDRGDNIVAEERSEEDLDRDRRRIRLLRRRAARGGGRTFRCRIVVRDLETGAAAVAGETWTPPAAGTMASSITAPLLLKPDRGASSSEDASGPDDTGDRPAADAVSALLGCDARQYAPYFGRTLAAETDIWAVLPCLDARAARPKMRIRALLKDKLTFEDIPVPLETLSESPCFGGSRVLVRLTIPAVETDEYTLRVIAEDPATGVAAEIGRDFLIEKNGAGAVGGGR